MEYLRPNSTSEDENTSVVDSMASAMRAKELPRIPAIPLTIASTRLETKLIMAVRMALL